MPRIASFACQVVLVTSALVACGGGTTDTSSTPPPSAPPTTASGVGSQGIGGAATPSGTAVQLPDLTGLPTPAAAAPTEYGAAKLPQAFPLPPGTSVRGVTDDGKEIAATLTVPSSDQAVAYWKSSLPPAGYTVNSVDTVAGLGEIRFTGHGCGGDSQLALQGTTVALQCDRT